MLLRVFLVIIILKDSLRWVFNCMNDWSMVRSIVFMQGQYHYLVDSLKHFDKRARKRHAPEFTIPWGYHQAKKLRTLKGKYELKAADYTPISFADTLTCIRLGRGMKQMKGGMYLPEFDFWVPLDSLKKGIYEGPLLQFPHQLAVKSGDELILEDRLELKRAWKKDRWVIRVKGIKPLEENQ